MDLICSLCKKSADSTFLPFAGGPQGPYGRQTKGTCVRTIKNRTQTNVCVRLVGEGGFEPPKPKATDLQSAPFDRSGIPPYSLGAGGRIRTPDLLITNQLLYQLSYTSISPANRIITEVF